LEVAIARNLEKRRRAKQAGTFLASIVESSTFAIFSVDLQGTVLTWNQKSESIFGFSSNEIVGENVAVLGSDALVRQLRSCTASVQPSGSGNSLQTALTAQNGRSIHVSIRLSPIRDRAGDVIGASLFVDDNRNGMRTMEKLLEGVGRFGEIFDRAPIGMMVLNPDGRLVQVNAAFCLMLGYSDLELLSKDVLDLTHPDDRLQTRYMRQQLIETPDRPAKNEKRYIHRSGAIVWARTSASLVSTDEGPRYFVVHVEDITEQRQNQEALRRSEAEFRTLFDVANDSIFILSLVDGRILAVNDVKCRRLGYSREEMLCMSVHQISGERDPEFVKKRFAELKERGAILFETTHVRKDGTAIPVEINTRQFEYRGIPAALAVVRDIRERKEAEAAMLKAKEAAEEATRAKSEFLANMSHEIRTPMNGVIGMTGLLLDTELTPQQRSYAEAARASAESLLGLINQILDFSKIEANKLELESTDFDLRGLLDSTVAMVASQAYAKGIELLCSVDPATPAIFRGDPGRLGQILTNLLGNAVKFTRMGEVVLRTSLIESGGRDCLLGCSVHDTGVGISKQKIGILFNKFNQVETSTTREFGGSGLGLAISKQLAELMGGEMGVTSEEGRGSTFWFTVRLGRCDDSAAAPATCQPAQKANGVRVLIVDDNASSREILAAQAASWGMRPAEAESGPWALQALYAAFDEGDPFQIALIDAQMPGMNGEALGRVIEADASLADTKLVMLTSLGGRFGAERLRQVGFANCLNKPVRRDELRSALSNALSEGDDPISGQVLDREKREHDRRRAKPFADSNARVLVAEDNFINQRVALGILNKLGLRAEAVADGAEAIRSLESIPYDLVFMDLRMPVMDGFDATRRIRDPQSPVLNHDLPIIAMTANVLQSDRYRCFEAGMNGFVSKPISPEAVEAALEQWLPNRKDAVHFVTNGPAASPPANAELPIFDRAGVMSRMMDDEELAAAVMAAFLDDMPRQIETLKEFAEARNAEGSGRQAHSIKGAAANVGGERLRGVAMEMEKAADAGDWGTVLACMDRLESQYIQLREAMANGSSPR